MRSSSDQSDPETNVEKEEDVELRSQRKLERLLEAKCPLGTPNHKDRDDVTKQALKKVKTPFIICLFLMEVNVAGMRRAEAYARHVRHTYC